MPRFASLAVLLLSTAVGFAADPPYQPFVAPASKEGEQEILRFEVAKGMKVDLYAAEPMLANPVCFCFDDKGRLYVAETFRHHAGVTDTRGHMYWLDDDLACRNIDDRVAMYRKWLKDKFPTYSVEHERVRLIEDMKGTGKADKATVFADGFKNTADGIAAGLLPIGDSVFYTCIPDLWKLKGPDASGKSTGRESYFYGFGVHTGFLGHDLHGLKLGPDGRLYFSIGDRGLHVTTKEGKVLDFADGGAVLRCELDGSKLELFATGLRNPQELAFDEFGNLFTCDNNSDSGDRARWLHLVEGGEYGWRMGFQYHDAPTSRGPWNNEMLWAPDVANRAAYIIPPIRNFADGPSGLTYHPGTSKLAGGWEKTFFLCDFRGTSSQSGIRTVKLKRKGASFEWDKDDRIVWRVLVTDCDFGPDGSLYFSDWVEGWDKPNKGRVFKLSAPGAHAAADTTKSLLAQDWSKTPVADLAKLLENPDYRVRQHAQMELASRREWKALGEVAKSSSDQLARIHAIWGLGQILRLNPGFNAARNSLYELHSHVSDDEAAALAKVLGDAHDVKSRDYLIKVLTSSWPPAQFQAAIALGKIGQNDIATAALLTFVEQVGSSNPILRHAGVMGLAGAAPEDAAKSVFQSDKAAVRLAGVLALRRRHDPQVAVFLPDSDAMVALEAARAIHDAKIAKADASLAAAADAKTSTADPYLRRVLAACYRVGDAEAIARTASRTDVPGAIRNEAVYELLHWAKPSGRDRVTGLWRPIEARSPDAAATALRAAYPAILKTNDNATKRLLVEALAELGIAESADTLKEIFADSKAAGSLRAECLEALARLQEPTLAGLVKNAVASGEQSLASEGRRQLAKLDPVQAVPLLEQVVGSASIRERQAGLATLAEMKTPAAASAVARLFTGMREGKLPADVQLDVLTAAEKLGGETLKRDLATWNAGRPKSAIGGWLECLQGGDAEAGRKIFRERTDVSCQRCHRIAANGGEVGPELTSIGRLKARDYILESLMDPNAKIAEGFETVVLSLEDGTIATGVLKSETPTEIRLMTAEAKTIVVPKSRVEQRKRGPSAMPADLAKRLTKFEIRDLVEFLASQKK